MLEIYTRATQCRLCGGNKISSLINLGVMSLTGVFPKNGAEKVPAGPLELVKCEACDLVQLAHSYDLNQLYGENYGYRSGLNGSMVRHLNSKVNAIVQWVDLGKGDLVIDIGSNDSTTLRAYPDRQLELVGIDPSAEKFRGYYPSDVKLVVDFFTAEKVRALVGNKKAKVVTSIAMFYDLENPLAFMRDVAEVLADDGVWVFEQSYLSAMLDTNSYDTICHEHLEYYGLKQIHLMTEKAGLKILDVEFSDVNGGSFSVTASLRSGPLPENKRLIEEVLAKEEARQIYSPKRFAAFNERIGKHRTQVQDFFARAADEKTKVLGYGASTKGNVLLQYCGITAKELPCIAEVNDDKYGAFTPGTQIPIISEAEAKQSGVDAFFVLPWHFRASILQRERAFLKSGGAFVFPLPELEVVRQVVASQDSEVSSPSL